MTCELLKVLYEKMESRINEVVERRSIDGYVTDEEALRTFDIWHKTPGFTRQDHPAIVQVHSFRLSVIFLINMLNISF